MCLGDVLEKINCRANGKKKKKKKISISEKKKCRHFEWKSEKKIITLPQSDYEVTDVFPDILYKTIWNSGVKTFLPHQSFSSFKGIFLMKI